MDEADDRLRALFAQDLPPPRDPEFSAAVMEHLMRRRFQWELALLAGATVLVGLAVWALWPALQPLLVSLSEGLAPVAAILALVAGAVLMLGGKPERELGFQS
jgi:hypothetical protein